MNIYLATRTDEYPASYDEYDGFVVAAKDEKRAAALVQYVETASYSVDSARWSFRKIGITTEGEGVFLSSYIEA